MLSVVFEVVDLFFAWEGGIFASNHLIPASVESESARIGGQRVIAEFRQMPANVLDIDARKAMAIRPSPDS